MFGRDVKPRQPKPPAKAPANRMERILHSPVTEFISRSYSNVLEDAPLESALQAYKDSPTRSVLVMQPGGTKLRGLITDDDLTKLGSRDHGFKNAKDIATTSDIIAIRDNAELGQLIKILNGGNRLKRRLEVVPVVDGEQNVVGLATRAFVDKKLSDL